MAAQIRIFSLKDHQAKRIDDLAEELGGMSKAGQYVIDFFIQIHDTPIKPENSGAEEPPA